ncbi:uncharacterized transposon-derived [Paramuricea clavata]|uniref:Uncharacterized transposon-derived n=1 Tax=Paramuricea clavata TaxID=317549 RepID=A0A6S7J968_PARCT|nr:uncharacterized transposon-derived [Paramuricea clavata]
MLRDDPEYSGMKLVRSKTSKADVEIVEAIDSDSDPDPIENDNGDDTESSATVWKECFGNFHISKKDDWMNIRKILLAFHNDVQHLQDVDKESKLPTVVHLSTTSPPPVLHKAVVAPPADDSQTKKKSVKRKKPNASTVDNEDKNSYKSSIARLFRYMHNYDLDSEELFKTKSATNVAKKSEELLLEWGVPKKVQSDEGKEFSLIKRKLGPQYGFKLFHTFNRETKEVHAERFIQTFKQMVRRTLTTLDLGFRYIHYLPLILERYNESPHQGLFGAYTARYLCEEKTCE